MFSGYYLFGKIKKNTGYPKNNRNYSFLTIKRSNTDGFSKSKSPRTIKFSGVSRGFNIYVLQIFATIDTIVPVLVYGIFMN